MDTVIEQSIQKAMTYESYVNLFEKLVEEGKTTGPNESEGYVSYTKLNLSRFKRATSNSNLTSLTSLKLQDINVPLTLLVITEAWCGDASYSLPVFEKIANASGNINLKIVLRDENDALINQFLTNNGKAIPKVIILDEKNNVVADWGPRPHILQEQVKTYKAETPEATGMDISKITQKWYTEDKGYAMQNEITSLLVSAFIKV